jgi:hypothetical protein
MYWKYELGMVWQMYWKYWLGMVVMDSKKNNKSLGSRFFLPPVCLPPRCWLHFPTPLDRSTNVVSLVADSVKWDRRGSVNVSVCERERERERERESRQTGFKIKLGDLSSRLETAMYEDCHPQRTPRGFLNFVKACQGDRMSLWKHRPKCGPNTLFVKLDALS